MKVSHEIKDSFKILGLNNYESKVYITLNKVISGTAREIGEAAEVPRPRVYSILQELVKKGFVEVADGKPLKFTVVPPHDAFKKHRNWMNQTLDQAESDLNIIYESNIPSFPAPIWVVNGPEKIIKKEMEIISRAEDNLLVLAGFMFEDELSLLRENLQKVVKKGVKVRINARSPLMVGETPINIQEELKDLEVDVKFATMPFIKMVARDRKEMLVSFSRTSEENIIPESAVAIWNHYEEFVHILSGVFEPIWQYGSSNPVKNSFKK